MSKSAHETDRVRKRGALYNPYCRLCPLHLEARTVCVGKRGEPRLPGMIIGEAPGRNEDAAGRPFIGQAGRVLDRALQRALGRWDVADVVITNAVKCRPPRNRQPYPSEIKTCMSAYLLREIERFDPKYLLAVGNAAASALLGRSGVTALRGQWYDVDLAGPRRVMVTFHPAYLLYQGLDSKVAEQFRLDVNAFGARVIRGRGPRIREREV